MNEINPQIFHDRSYNAAIEIRKILISLATGILAVYFIVLTQEVKPGLSSFEKATLTFSIILFSLTIFFGILAWHSDNKRFFYRAKESENPLGKEAYSPSKDYWFNKRRFSDKFFFSLFFAGILCSSIFLFLRIAN